MRHFETQWYSNGEFRRLPGKPEDHNLVESVVYSFERNGELWTIYMCDSPIKPPAARQTSLAPQQQYTIKHLPALIGPNRL